MHSNESRRVQQTIAKDALDRVTGKCTSPFAFLCGKLIRDSAREADEALRWLEPDFEPTTTDPFTMHWEMVDKQEPHTCTWMTESVQWKDWLKGGSLAAGGHRRFMWIHGLPGTGKTILASFLIQELPRFGSSFYYCYERHNRDETVPFLRWVIRDLCKQLKDANNPAQRLIPKELRRLWERKQLTVESLKDCLEAIVEHFHLHLETRVYIIVDAVDESQSVAPHYRQRFLNVLTSIGTEARFKNVSLLMTSRPYPDITKAIESLRSITPPLSTLVLPMNTLALRQRPLPQSNNPLSLDPGAFQPLQTFPPPRFPSSHEAIYLSDSSDESIRPRSQSPTKRKPSGEQPSGDQASSPPKRPRKHSNEPGVSPCTRISMANTDVQKAIELYVDKRLREHKRFPQWSKFVHDMKRELAAKAGGIFRTVVCHLDMINRNKCTSLTEVMECINTMPESIFETYEKILVEGIGRDDDLGRHNVEFARTALALICSETANIPDAGVLVEASHTNLPQRMARDYDCARLGELLGCLVKQNSLPKPQTLFQRKEEDPAATLRFSVAHYTVKEFLYSPVAARGKASYFALNEQITEKLELRIVFEGLGLFDRSPRAGHKPTRFQEYCLGMTEKALAHRPAIVETEKELWEAVFPCLSHTAVHPRSFEGNRNVIRPNFPIWSSLSPFQEDEYPACSQTSVLVNLLLLDWPELARIYLENLTANEKFKVWRDKFKLNPTPKSPFLPQTNLAQMCVSRRRLDFLKIFTAHGARFQKSQDILYRAMSETYGKDDTGGRQTELILKELLNSGANPNPKGFCVTPLQVAAHHHERPWVMALLFNKAKPLTIGDSTGVDPLPLSDDTTWYRRTPLQICKELEESMDQNVEARAGRVRRLLEKSEAGEIVDDGGIIFLE